LRFETQGAQAAAAEPETTPPSGGTPREDIPKPERGAAEVVSLDKFRK
jgi:hypothetical protein